MSMDDCFGEVSRAGGGLSRADAQGVLQAVLDRGDRSGDHIGAARELGDLAAAAAAIERRNRLINLRNRISRRARIEGRLDTLRARFGDQALSIALENEARAFNTPTEGGRFSAEAQARAQSELYAGGAMRDLTKAGLVKPLRDSKSFARDVGREIYELSRKAAGEDGKPGVTRNAAARQAAEILHGYQSLARQNLNRAGAWIGDYAGYITRTTHDPAEMYRAGFEGWRDAILPLLDHARTFEGIENRENFLRGVYNALITGLHLTDDGGVGFKDPAFTGPANLAEKLSAQRVLHFRNADAWLDYQDRFGAGPLAEQFETAFRRAGKQQALMERWGTNPRAEFENDIRFLAEKYRDSDPEGVKHLLGRQDRLMTTFGYLDGRNNIPVNEQRAALAQGIRNIQSMAHLGFVAFTHLFSMATKASELRYQGLNLLERWGNVLSSLAQGPRGHGELRNLYDLILAGFDGQHSHFMSSFTLDDSVPGMMSRATSTFMKWSGLDYVLGAEKAGARAMIARHLGMQVDRDFAALEPETRRAFLQYGISPQEWDRLRLAPDHFRIDDRVFLTPDAAHRATAEPDLAGKDLFAAAERDMLALKLHAYMADVADRSVVTPGIAEKALLLGSNRPGSLLGEALRFTLQFKTWPAAALRQTLGREWQGNDTTGSAVMGIMSLVVASTILGYGRMAVTDLMKGLVPRDPRDAATWGAALAQGGGMGILGDYLFGETGRNDQSLAENLAGPTFGTASQIAHVYNAMKDAALAGDTRPARAVPAELFRITLDNTPFLNMFYARTALNYLLLWRIQEALNPGFQRRYERRVQRQRGQTFWLSPARAVRGGDHFLSTLVDWNHTV
jgi:hypothetical protein